jgi:hypothetical protein
MKSIKLYLILIICGLYVPIVGQNIDSLTKVYNNTSQADSNRLKAINNIASIFRDDNPDPCIIIA